MDEEDVDFLNKVLKEDKKFDVDEATFEGMLDRLEKNSGHSVIEVQEAKSLLQEDDELILAGTYIFTLQASSRPLFQLHLYTGVQMYWDF